MDRERLARLILVAGAVITLAAAAFAVGAAISSADDTSGADDAAIASSATDGTTATNDAPTSAAAAASSPPATATARADIEISEFQFLPQEMVVQPGTEVVWTNADSTEHSVVSVGGKFQTSEPLGQGDVYAFVFTTPGTYQYFCGFHNSMTGTVVVEG
jgi:plastocyanin